MKVYMITRHWVWYEGHEKLTSDKCESAVALVFLDETKARQRLAALQMLTKIMSDHADAIYGKYEAVYKERTEAHNKEELDFNNSYLLYNTVKEHDPLLPQRIGFNPHYSMLDREVTE